MGPEAAGESAASGPATASGSSLVGVLVGVVGTLVAGWLAVLTAVVAAFLTPLRIGTVPVPLCWAVVAGGTLGAVWLVRVGSGTRIAVLFPAAAWLATVVLLAGRRNEGDLVVSGSWVGYGVLLLGAVTLSSAVFLALTTRPSPR